MYTRDAQAVDCHSMQVNNTKSIQSGLVHLQKAPLARRHAVAHLTNLSRNEAPVLGGHTHNVAIPAVARAAKGGSGAQVVLGSSGIETWTSAQSRRSITELGSGRRQHEKGRRPLSPHLPCHMTRKRRKEVQTKKNRVGPGAELMPRKKSTVRLPSDGVLMFLRPCLQRVGRSLCSLASRSTARQVLVQVSDVRVYAWAEAETPGSFLVIDIEFGTQQLPWNAIQLPS